MVCILIFLLAIHSIIFITYPIYKIVNNQTVQTGCTPLSAGVKSATDLFHIFFRVAIPMGLMIIFDACVFARLRKSKNNVHTNNLLNENNAKQPRQKGQMSLREYKFLMSTMVIDVVFFAFHMLIVGTFGITVVNLFYTTSSIATRGTMENAIFLFFFNLSQLLGYAYVVVVFFASLAFNNLFRKECKQIILFRNTRRHAVGTTNET
jgi:hypothetical protein